MEWACTVIRPSGTPGPVGERSGGWLALVSTRTRQEAAHLNGELQWLGVGVDHDVEVVLAVARPGEVPGQGVRLGRDVGRTRGAEPAHVVPPEPAARDAAPGLAQRDHALDEAEQLPVRRRAAPSRARWSRCPGCRGCCCRAACWRTRRRPRTSARRCQQQQGEEVLHLPQPQRQHRRRGRRRPPPSRSSSSGCRLEPSVPSWPLASLCLLVVGHQVVEAEAVVGGDEVDALVGAVDVARAVGEQVALP